MSYDSFQIHPQSLKTLKIENKKICLIDIRESHERDLGFLEGSLHVPKSKLCDQIQTTYPNKDQLIVLYCQVGKRSAQAASDLQALGYTHVKSLAGGFLEWCKQDLAIVEPHSLSSKDKKRYARHLSLKEVGAAGQNKLLNAKVLLIGCGGLGSPAALYLAAAGVGTIGLVDDDVVDESNLQRQVLHNETTIGKKKVDSAKEHLQKLNSGIQIQTFQTRLNKDNAADILKTFDIIVNGSDNFPTRYLVSDACVLYKKKLVDASVQEFTGQLRVYNPENKNSPCYRCLFPTPPQKGEVPNCAEAGVLGVLPGLLGTLQATEVIKLILEQGESLDTQIVSYNALSQELKHLNTRKDPECVVCSEKSDFEELNELKWSC